MKKYLSFMAFAVMAVCSLVVSSCGGDDDDDEGSSSELDYIEVTIDGTTKKTEYVPGLGFTYEVNDEKGNKMDLFRVEYLSLGKMGEISMPIALYTYKSDFKAQTGKYRLRKGSWEDFYYGYIDGKSYELKESDRVCKPFDLWVLYVLDDNSEYVADSEGTYSITQVAERTYTFEGLSEKGYVMKGSFSCKLKCAKTGDVKDCKGTFQYTYAPEDD
ncbi:MAG: hypothetical protein IKX24_00930 [Prevotella sp.]|nr:hypothetical protein [Prevotella sp.]